MNARDIDDLLEAKNPERRFIVLMSVAEHPNPGPGARRRHCQGCGCEVWIAPATIQFMISRIGEPWKLVCNACVTPFVSSDPNPTILTSLSTDVLDVIELKKPPR